MRRIFMYAFLSSLALIMIIPFLWMLLLSFKFQAEISMANTILPNVWTLRNYFRVFETVPIIRWFLNSVAVTVSATAIILFTSSLVGFVFAKYEFRLKNVLFWFILATMMVSPQTTMIPSFILITRLRLYDRLPSLVIPGMVGGFGIFLCRQFIEDIPNSLCEAARIDGAKDFYVYFRIILPLIRPAIGALTIFTFLQYWNEYMLPLLYLNRIENMTMSLAISFFSTQRTTDIGAIMAAATLVMLPVAIVFLMFQKQFIKGIAIAGLK
ncbi:MAG: carbohydrate ABC transporter permease [Treponema sp.]|nr:carbohydrate ABC transporter permease [Treponema sp.]